MLHSCVHEQSYIYCFVGIILILIVTMSHPPFPACTCRHLVDTYISDVTSWKRSFTSRQSPHGLEHFHVWLQEHGLHGLWGPAKTEEQRYRSVLKRIEAGEERVDEIAHWKVDLAKTRKVAPKLLVKQVKEMVPLAIQAVQERKRYEHFDNEDQIREREAKNAADGTGNSRILELPKGSVEPVLHKMLEPSAWYHGHPGGSYIFNFKSEDLDPIFDSIDFVEDNTVDNAKPEHNLVNFQLIGLVPRSKREYLLRMERIYPDVMSSLLALIEFHCAHLKVYKSVLQQLERAIRVTVSTLALNDPPFAYMDNI